MCGIAGIWSPVPPGAREAAWRAEVARMLSAQRHRGPDESAAVASSAGVLGACRLAVTDPARGSQPMTTADGRHAVALNGAVVNHVELRAALASGGAPFRTTCDTEVVLEGLARRGAAFLGETNGMFAIAWFDDGDGSALLARDPCGIKPLFWWDRGDRVLFASEIAPLLAVADARPAVDREALLDGLSFHAPLTDATWFEGIRAVPPGAMLRLRRGRAPQIVPLPAWTSPPEVPDDPDAAAEALRALLDDAVRIHLRADVAVGATLSGGVDSSYVAARAARHLGRPLPVFTGAFDLAGFDEREHARGVAAEIGATPYERVLTPEALGEAWPRAALAMGEPAAGPGLLAQWFVAEEAARHVRVVLGGQGADELFGGYARHLIVRLAAAARAAATREDPRGLASLGPHAATLRGYEPLARRALAAGAEGGPAAAYLATFHRGAGLDRVLAGDLQADLARHPVAERFAAAFAACAGGAEDDGDGAADVRRALRFERRHLLPALLQVDDRTTSAWSVEGRSPFLDRRVLSFVDRCPSRVLLGDGAPKFLLRRAVAGDLPRAARERRDKMGFPVPLAPWARGPLRASLHDLLAGGALRARGWIEEAAVPRLLDGAPVDARHLWSVVNLELWTRTHCA